MPKYRIRKIAPGAPTFTLIHPDGHWIGPGLGEFRSIAAAMDWLRTNVTRHV